MQAQGTRQQSITLDVTKSSMNDFDSYWLTRWIDDHEIHSTEHARVELMKGGGVEILAEYAQNAGVGRVNPDDEPAVLAGRALDLSGTLDVYVWPVLRQRVDELLKKVWHYFDK